jgi:hypothetical protein
MLKRCFATLKELRLLCERRTATQPSQGCASVKRCASSQGFKANPGLQLANAFSVIKVAELTAEPAIDFTSGYVLRALHTLPRQGSKTPWRVHQNYVKDLSMLRFGRVDDGTMEFKAAPRGREVGEWTNAESVR